MINLIPADVGLLAGYIVSNLVDYNRLVEDIRQYWMILCPARPK